MSRQPTEIEYASLGEYLRETRINLGLDLVAVAGETKISPKSLQAIEENDFAALPAEAFTRGFYTLYAKSLSLDCTEVLKMYGQQKPKQPKSGNLSTITSTKAQEVGSMAERPAFMPVSFLGLVLLLLLLFGGFLCWFFSWNPATYLSQQLRGLEEPQQIEQVSVSRTETGTSDTTFSFAQLQRPRSRHSDIFNLSYPSTATAAIAEDMPKPTTLPPPQISRNSFNTQFSEETTGNIPRHLLQ